MEFPNLNKYGNYSHGTQLPTGVIRVPCDGTVRRIKKAGIPFVEIVEVVNVYGHHYAPNISAYAIHESDISKIEPKKERKLPRPHQDLVLCIREASRAAHRERDMAQLHYQTGLHDAASSARYKKEAWYNRKERGIVAAHKTGLFKYIGKTAQNRGVYEYGEGGRSCFHSTLHPIGTEQKLIEGHPEILIVEAKSQSQGCITNEDQGHA